MRRSSLVVVALFFAVPVHAEPRIEAPPVVAGMPPVIRGAGLPAKATVRVHAFRMFSRWQTDDPQMRTGWKAVPVVLQAWADVRTDRQGRFDLAKARVASGTYRGADPYGLLWSGRKEGDALLAAAEVDGFDPRQLREGATEIVLSVGGAVIARQALLSVSPPNLTTRLVEEGGLNGAFAVPADGKRYPSLLLLHGSEGGDRDGAMALAQRFAGQGYAALAINYFAWDLKNLDGIPNAHVNQPIELLSKARDWLARQPGADTAAMGVYGHSKGAEYAAVAAVHLPWIRAVAACVPSDSVWEGYGLGDARNRPQPDLRIPAQMSSWSWQGKPLPYIALPPSDDRSKFFNNTAYYEHRRMLDPVRAAEARIPVERSRAHFLWLGGGRDEVWASGEMARRNHAALVKAGRGRQSELHVYARSGHGICGDGTYPTHLWSDQSSDPRRPDLDADGQATVDAWQQMKAFFRRTLQGR